ncbi:MAG: substrate-binding domain-containing protein [Alphaproteobacteria bacterium]|nr:substrate-binding domain-containing protein [Alphaproteobacteria bacterium]
MRPSAVLIAAALALTAFPALAREEIRAVGSSTVFPFVATVAEDFGKLDEFRTPIVEATGTGGGFKLFCGGVGEQFADIANASRPIKDSEKASCKENGVTGIIEIKIGYDGIVLADTKDEKPLSVTKDQIFLALAKKVPVKGKLIDNPYQKWNEIDSSLPDKPIEVYGPPPTSGTRDAFAELVMEQSCKHFPEFKAAFADEDTYKKSCMLVREDGRFIEAGENDNLIVQKLEANTHAYGIFGFSFLDQNGDALQAATVDGVTPGFEQIASGEYSISRALYVYVKKDHIGTIPGLREFMAALTGESAIGAEGYLTYKGLIPMPKAEWEKVRTTALDARAM